MKLVTDTNAASTITDHAFVPRGLWWSLCKVCSLAEAAHRDTMLNPGDKR